jgi:hypothetical protein
MKTDLVTMSTTEMERLAQMRRIAERRTTQREAAEQLGLGLRQVERLYALYKADGAPGLVSKRRGAASNRRLPAQLRRTTLGIVRALYADFGPTLAHEKLVEKHGLALSVETLRTWMREDGLWQTRRERRKRAQQPRRRRAAKSGDGVTQFGRALGELNIDIICANPPAAKGRVERANLTLQDRLVKELRLRDISTVEAGNAYLPEFGEDYNRRSHANRRAFCMQSQRWGQHSCPSKRYGQCRAWGAQLPPSLLDNAARSPH